MIADPGDPTRRFGSRWWLLAAIAFAVVSLVLSPVTLVLFGFMFIVAGFSGRFLPVHWLWAAVLLLAAPGLAAFGLATMVERLLRRSGRPDRARRWSWRAVVTALVAVSPFVFLPALFVIGIQSRIPSKGEQAAQKQYALRPIVASDSMGFCSVPVWRVRDRAPEFTVAVRVPRRANYALTVHGGFGRRSLPSKDGTAYSESDAMGFLMREFGPGVDTLTVRLDNAGTSPPTSWPIRIWFIQIARADSDLIIDGRYGDSLYVIDSTGVRTSGR